MYIQPWTPTTLCIHRNHMLWIMIITLVIICAASYLGYKICTPIILSQSDISICRCWVGASTLSVIKLPCSMPKWFVLTLRWIAKGVKYCWKRSDYNQNQYLWRGVTNNLHLSWSLFKISISCCVQCKHEWIAYLTRWPDCHGASVCLCKQRGGLGVGFKFSCMQEFLTCWRMHGRYQQSTDSQIIRPAQCAV